MTGDEIALGMGGVNHCSFCVLFFFRMQELFSQEDIRHISQNGGSACWGCISHGDSSQFLPSCPFTVTVLGISWMWNMASKRCSAENDRTQGCLWHFPDWCIILRTGTYSALCHVYKLPHHLLT